MPQPMTLPFQEHPDAPRVKDIYHSLARAGHQLLIVGGAVRDWILGLEPKDLDLVTTATPDELEDIFPKTVPVGRTFGVMLIIQDGQQFEIATLRTEGRYLDGRHPEQVAWGTIDQDVHRRDFTINSIYYDPFKGVVYDLVGGLDDLRAGLIRTVGEARKRFDEDHLRVLRAYRFRAQTGFRFDENLQAALRDCRDLLREVSGERIRDELTRLFEAPERQKVIEELVQDGVLKVLLPQLKSTALDLKAYREWTAPTTTRLLELFRWVTVLGHGDADLLKDVMQAMKLSRDEKKALDEAMVFWREPNFLKDASMATLVLRQWSPHFCAGLQQFLSEDATGSFAPETELGQKVSEARRIKQRWGARTPEPWMKAADFPDLKGAALGAQLKKSYEEQIVSDAGHREEFLKWKKKANGN